MAIRQVGYSTWTGNQGTSLITFNLNWSGTQLGSQVIELDQLQIAYSVKSIDVIDLSSGFNSISIPVSATNVRAVGCFVIPPSGNTTTITFKGITGDTGLPQNPGMIQFITFPTTSAPTTFGITTGAALSGVQFVWV